MASTIDERYAMNSALIQIAQDLAQVATRAGWRALAAQAQKISSGRLDPPLLITQAGTDATAFRNCMFPDSRIVQFPAVSADASEAMLSRLIIGCFKSDQHLGSEEINVIEQLFF